MATQDLFFSLIVQFAALKQYTHSAHHLVKGALFYQDHGALGDLYDTYDDEFDGAAERFTALYGSYEPQDLFDAVRSVLIGAEFNLSDNKSYFKAIMDMEKSLCVIADELAKAGDLSEGSKNYFADTEMKSEERQYKIGRRII